MNSAGTRPTLAALVPMRHHSSRVPGKNYRLVLGKPLFAYILESLQQCPEIDEIIVDTDSPTIRDGVARSFPAVRLLERPEPLRGDQVPMHEIVVSDAERVAADLYLQTHSTNPLLRPTTISSAIQTLLHEPEHDALFGVTRRQVRLWTADGTPLNHDPARLMRTQDLPPVFEENSCLYIVRRESLLQSQNRLGLRPRMYEIDPLEAWDIDEEEDLWVAEALLAGRARPASPNRGAG
jgi:CMP-N-acetylneuraminic acid synthetase